MKVASNAATLMARGRWIVAKRQVRMGDFKSSPDSIAAVAYGVCGGSSGKLYRLYRALLIYLNSRVEI